MKCFQLTKQDVLSGIEVSRPLFKRSPALVKVGEKKVPLSIDLSEGEAFVDGRLVEAAVGGTGETLELVAVAAGDDRFEPGSVLVRFSIDLQLNGVDEIKLDGALGQAQLLMYHRKQHVSGPVGFGAGVPITLVYHSSEGLLVMAPGSEVVITDKARFAEPTGLFGWLRGEEPDYHYQTNTTVIRFDGENVTVDSRPYRVHNY